MKKAVVLSLALCVSDHAAAEWQESSVKDEMRGKTTAVFVQSVKPINGAGPTIRLTVLDSGDGRPGVVINVEGDVVDKCPAQDSAYCEANVKFDDGEIDDGSFASKDGTSLIPMKVVAFAGTIAASKTLYLELELKKNGRTQYKIDTAGLKVKIAETTITVHGFEMGKSYAGEKLGLREKKTAGDRSCYEVVDSGPVMGDSKAKDARLCFFKDVFYSASVTPGSKAAYESGKAYLSSVLGKPDPDGIYPSWPNNGDKVLDKATKSAFYMNIKKNDYASSFLITDDIVDPLVPADKPQ